MYRFSETVTACQNAQINKPSAFSELVTGRLASCIKEELDSDLGVLGYGASRGVFVGRLSFSSQYLGDGHVFYTRRDAGPIYRKFPSVLQGQFRRVVELRFIYYPGL